jgi:hypothetical protein
MPFTQIGLRAQFRDGDRKRNAILTPEEPQKNSGFMTGSGARIIRTHPTTPVMAGEIEKFAAEARGRPICEIKAWR